MLGALDGEFEELLKWSSQSSSSLKESLLAARLASPASNLLGDLASLWGMLPLDMQA